jgi:hypothetical protein
MRKTILYTTALLLLVGCGGGSGSSGNSSYEGPMNISTSYRLNSGDQIIRDSDDALLSITYTTDTQGALVILTQGAATLLRQP